MTAPGNLFIAPPDAVYDSDLRSALTARLAGDLTRGGAGYGQELESALWERSRRRMEDALAKRLAEIGDAFAARGCSALSGPMAALLREAYADHATGLADHDLDLLAKQADLAAANDRATMDHALALRSRS